MRNIIFVVLCLCAQFLQSQKKADTVFCDCEKARLVTLKQTTSIGPTIAPPDGGAIKEISPTKQNSRFSFDKEHYSAWYKLQIVTSGTLVLDIVPLSNSDDYDFMIFKAGSLKFCDSLLKHRVKPIRACISRNKKEENGLTGLRFKHEKEFINEGVGDSFLKPLAVNAGEVYYLVLDNVYKDGSGHSLKFAFEEVMQASGRVFDAEGHALVADITITNLKGDTLEKTISNKNGEYAIDAILRKNINYSINVFAENSFFYSKIFSTKTKDSLQNLKVVLQELKLGEKYVIGNINFVRNSDVYLKTAYPTLINLKSLLTMHPEIKIMIIGHTNGCDGGTAYSVDLSNNRAKAIKKFLTDSKINATRLSISGKGCSEMLYPLNSPEPQQMLNRRVEIFVLEN